MIKEAIDELRLFIQQHNTYFDNSYAPATINKAGHVTTSKGVIFPSDYRGDYFYLRITGDGEYGQATTNRISDCAVALALRVPIVFVAVVKNADPYTLVDNITWTLQRYNKDNIQLKTVVFERDDVIAVELAQIDEKDIQKAFKAAEGRTIIAIELSITLIIQPLNDLNCIQNPCTC